MERTMERSVEIQLQPDDLVLASKLQFLKGVRSAKGMTTILVAAALATTLYGLLIWDGDEQVAIAIFGVLSPLIVVCGPAFVVWFIGPRSARKLFAQQASLRQPYRLEWDEESYRAYGEGGQATIKWSDFFRVIQDDKVIVLFESLALRRLIPARFLSEAQRRDIEGIIAKAGK